MPALLNQQLAASESNMFIPHLILQTFQKFANVFLNRKIRKLASDIGIPVGFEEKHNMKIQRSDMARFLQIVGKTWKSKTEVDSQAVVFTFIESGYSISMAMDGLLLIYLCNRVDAEINEQSIALPFAFLIEYSTGIGIVELHEVMENGGGYILAKWFDGHVQGERRWPARDAPQYHLLQDLAWHTIDERQLIVQGLSQLATVTIASH